MHSMLVIGLGRFGKHLALRMAELGSEVMAVDTQEDAVNEVAPFVTRAMIGDCMDVDVLRGLGVSNFDVCFVCIRQNFQASLEITSLLKELGAKRVVSTADREIHSKFLIKIGADEVICPVRDMAQRTAVRYSVNAFEYIELTPDFAIFEMKVPKAWEGKTIRNLDVRLRLHVNIIGIREGDKITSVSDPDTVLSAGQLLILAGSKKEALYLMDR